MGVEQDVLSMTNGDLWRCNVIYLTLKRANYIEWSLIFWEGFTTISQLCFLNIWERIILSECLRPEGVLLLFLKVENQIRLSQLITVMLQDICPPRWQWLLCQDMDYMTWIIWSPMPNVICITYLIPSARIVTFIPLCHCKYTWWSYIWIWHDSGSAFHPLDYQPI